MMEASNTLTTQIICHGFDFIYYYINTLHATENKKVISVVLKEYSVIIIKWHILILQFPLAFRHQFLRMKRT